MARLKLTQLLIFIVSITTIFGLGCTPDKDSLDVDRFSGEPVCDEFDQQQCDCAVGAGYQYCLANGSGFGECVCAISEAEVGENVLQIDETGTDEVAISGERGLTAPLAGNEALANLSPGDYVQSWDLGLMGRVTGVTVENGVVKVETEACALTDVFKTLSIDYNRKINLAAVLPEEMKNELRKQKATRRSALRESPYGRSNKEIEGETEPVPGVNLSFSSEFDIGVEFEDTSYIDFMPSLYTKLRIKDFQLYHVAIDTAIDLDMLLELRASIEASATATAELDVLKLIAFLVSGVDDYVARYTISPGLELETWIILGITAGIDGTVEAVPYFETNGSAYGGAYYSKNWDDLVWDGAPERIQEGRKKWNTEQWYTEGNSDFTADAGLSEFSWGAHGGIEAYLKAKYALTFFRCGGPTFEAKPYIGFNAWIGDKNKLEAAMGVLGNVGGKVEIFAEETLWEQDWEIFNYKYILWEYSWMLCGDGIRSTECYDLECDHCPNAGCGGEPEECDAGLFAVIPGQGSDALGNAKPCVDCTCGNGWAPATGDEWFWPPTAEDDVQWGDKRNWCVRTCGNGIVEPEEGEVCDHSGNPGCESNCNEDCTAFFSVCGDGNIECYEQCDDGNTESCDGCSEYCVEEPGSGGCGDGYRCGDEECDDANDDECDGCYSDCTRRVYSCGDGYQCGSEGCDDGNTIACDGCSSNCQPETGCGDGFTCGAEECDDGNLAGNDGCSADCKTEGCGDGVVQSFFNEECDDGNRIDCDGCHGNCKLDTGCGDRTVCTQQGEQCEDGNSIDCDSCHNDCTLTLDVCGDGHACGDEVCDDGNYTPGDGCSVNCMSDETCGNGAIDTAVGEECDDGNTVSCDGCSNICTDETGCGDGVVCGTEICDDGNVFSGDGCRSDCMGFEVCGDGLIDNGESCEDDTVDGIDLDCSSTYPDCVMDCNHCAARCGDGVQAPGENCEVDPDGTDYGCSALMPVCSADCQTCEVDCSDNICGDGKVCGEEVCDDSNTDDCTGTCSADCMTEITGCGDGITCGSEECDDGNTTGGDGCRADCLGTELCNDGLLDEGELCEDDSVDGIDSGCTAEEPDCGSGCSSCSARCGDLVIGTGEYCEDTSNGGIDDGCTAGSPVCLSSCAACVLFICGDGEVTGTEVCDDGNTDDCIGACSGDCSTVLTGCGDGVTCGEEMCDDGNHDNWDGCSADCLSDETCGNSVTDTIIGEQCDDGNQVGEDGCSADCSSNETCGNGKVDDYTDDLLDEVCDDGNTDNCTGNCAEDCMSFFEPVCGDAYIDPECEVCEDSDPANASVDNGCSAGEPNCNSCTSCSADVCGDGIVGSTEDCDEGGTCSDNENSCTTLDKSNCEYPDPATCENYNHSYGDGTFCAYDCTFNECGDGVISTLEVCENTYPTNATMDAGCTVTDPNCSPGCNFCTTEDL